MTLDIQPQCITSVQPFLSLRRNPSMADQDHLALLKRGVAAWNEWRKQNPQVQPDLSGAVLPEADLKEIDLRRVNLSEADLSGADLRGALLDEADLSETRLIKAQLSFASLRDASLCKANLSGGAILLSATLSFADLRESDLREADLSGANLREADLSGVNLEHADLTSADLRAANLSAAQCQAARFEAACLTRANLSHANLSDALLDRANLSHANLSHALLSEAALVDAVLYRVDLREANLDGAYLTGADLREADLSKTLLRAELAGADLRRANLKQANLRGAWLTRAIVTDANMTEADLTGCDIHGIAAWDVQLQDAVQWNLLISGVDENFITVDNFQVAQLLQLVLYNQEIMYLAHVSIEKLVLVLGYFDYNLQGVLEAITSTLRQENYLPVVFQCSISLLPSWLENLSLLTSLARFIIVDATFSKSVPQQIEHVISHFPSLPIQPLLHVGWKREDVLNPLKHYSSVLETYRYSSVEELAAQMKERVIEPAERRLRKWEKG